MKVPPSTQTQKIVEMIKSGQFNPQDICPVPMPSLSACLNELMGPSGLTATTLAELAGLHRSSMFRILSGDTTPSRNVLLSIAFVLGITYEETQTLLKCGGCAALSGSSKRDILLMDGIISKKSLGEIDEILRESGFKGLIKA